jgi:ferredoxin--NADP+ reductase
MGNTALDVARVLLTPPEQLARTDMADAALGALRQSRLRHVVILGRRGPAEAAFDPRELKSLGALPDLSIRVDPRDLGAAEWDGGERSKLFDVLSAYASSSPPDTGRTVTLRFRLSPVELVGPEHVRAIRVESRQKTLTGWCGTGQTEVLAADLVLSAVGFRGEPLAGVPFDAGAGVVPSDRGRVGDGLYVTGWLKRGARGLLGTTKADSYETVERMLEALPHEGRRGLGPPSGPRGRLLERGVRVVGLDDWHRLDRLEVARGRVSGQPRRKFASVSEMLAALDVGGLTH